MRLIKNNGRYSFICYNKDDGSAVAATADDADTSAYDKIVAEVDTDNAKIKSDSDAAIDAKAAFAKQMVSSSGDDSTGAVRITGSDSEIVLMVQHLRIILIIFQLMVLQFRQQHLQAMKQYQLQRIQI